jgi:hypothetical protein
MEMQDIDFESHPEFSKRSQPPLVEQMQIPGVYASL